MMRLLRTYSFRGDRLGPDPQSRRFFRWPERAFVLVSLAGVALLYAAVAAHFNGFHAFWSADSGARFAMIQNGLRHGSFTALTYGNAAADPAGSLHPLQFYVMRGPRGFNVMYPPLFPWLCGQGFRLWGFGGLTPLPLAAGLGTLWVTHRTAARLGLRSARFLPLAMGLATPLVVYSVVFWDHTLLMLLAAGAGHCWLRALQSQAAESQPAGSKRAKGKVMEIRGLGFAAASGALLGAGVWVHELFLLLFAAVFLACLPLLRGAAPRRLVLGLTSAFLLVLLLWACGNRAMYGLWAGPHLMANVGHNKVSAVDHNAGVRDALDLRQIAARAVFQLVGSPDPAAAQPAGAGGGGGTVLLLVLGAIALTARLRSVLAGAQGGKAARLAPCLQLALYLAAAAVAARLLRCWVPSSGLFQVTPLLAPALAASWRGGTSLSVPEKDQPMTSSHSMLASVSPASVFCAWMGRVCALFALLVFVNPVLPGMDWGSRYLLTVLPFLVLLAAGVLERQYRDAPAGARRAFLPVLGVVLGVSAASQACGLAAVRNDLLYSRDLNRRAAALGAAPLATDIFWLGPELTASSPPQAQSLVRSEDDRRLFLAAQDRAAPPRRASQPGGAAGPKAGAGFTFMGTPGGLAALAQTAAGEGTPFRPVATWSGAGLVFARFAPADARPPAAVRAKHVLALYYPWYGTPAFSGRWLHQEPDEVDPKKMDDHVHFPALGAYDSTDPAVVERHLSEAQAAGIDTLVCSWWGRGDRTDVAVRLLLRRAAARSLKVCVLWEKPGDADIPMTKEDGAGGAGRRAAGLAPEGTAKPVTKAANAQADLTYLVDTLAKDPSYLRADGKPVIFLYPGTGQALTRQEWTAASRQAAAQAPPGVLLIGGEQFTGNGQGSTEAPPWGGLYTLNTARSMAGAGLAECAQIQRETFRPLAARAGQMGALCVETVLPGYDDRRVDDGTGRLEGKATDRRGGELYSALWDQAIQDGPDWVLVNSFNQWHNGTEIEPSVEMGDGYLALTQRFAARFKGPPAAPPREKKP